MHQIVQNVLFIIAVIGVAAVHFVTSFFVAFAAGISPSGQNSALGVIANILTFPLQLIPEDFPLPESLSFLPWIVLSLCWGLAICFGMRALFGQWK